jgi:hypothetical protein
MHWKRGQVPYYIGPKWVDFDIEIQPTSENRIVRFSRIQFLSDCRTVPILGHSKSGSCVWILNG